MTMAKRIWFKPDCVRWIREGKKTTTFRKTKHEGIYQVVRGSWFKAEPVGLRVRLTLIVEMPFEQVISLHYGTEGDFETPLEFADWLSMVGLKYRTEQLGWLHNIEVIEARRGE